MIRHILFDVDCTLYSSRYGFEENVVNRMMQYIAQLLGVDVEEAAAERNKHIGRYGTTLEWLMAEKNFTNIDDYFVKIHPENEADSLPPDPELRKFIKSLPCPCSVLTNAPLFHAERIIQKLEMEGVFLRVFDIIENGYKGKPHASAYRYALDSLGLQPDEVLFIDDIPRYVQGYLAMGGKGVLYDELDAYAGYPNERIKSLYELTRFLDQA